MLEKCNLCQLELCENIYVDKIDLKHLRENHPYIKSIKAYRTISQLLQNVYNEKSLIGYDPEKEKHHISEQLKPLSKIIDPFLISVIASLIASYIYSIFKTHKSERDKQDNDIYILLKKYQAQLKEIAGNIVYLGPSTSFLNVIKDVFSLLQKIREKNIGQISEYIKSIEDKIEITIIDPIKTTHERDYIKFISETMEYEIVGYEIDFRDFDLYCCLCDKKRDYLLRGRHPHGMVPKIYFKILYEKRDCNTYYYDDYRFLISRDNDQKMGVRLITVYREISNAFGEWKNLEAPYFYEKLKNREKLIKRNL